MSQELTYEEALDKLDEQLKLLEDGNLSLEDALKAVDEAHLPEDLHRAVGSRPQEDRGPRGDRPYAVGAEGTPPHSW